MQINEAPTREAKADRKREKQKERERKETEIVRKIFDVKDVPSRISSQVKDDNVIIAINIYVKINREKFFVGEKSEKFLFYKN